MCYRLTSGVFLIPFGHIADSYPSLPRKTLLVTSLACFALLVALTSFSRTGAVLDFVAALAGVASAANIPFAVGILSLAYPRASRRKNLVFSSFLMGAPAATIIGGLGSGGLALRLGWRAPFVCLSALYAVIAILAWVFVPHVPDPRHNGEPSRCEAQPWQRQQGGLSKAIDVAPLVSLPVETRRVPRSCTALGRFDWSGLALLVVGVLLFTVALTLGPQGPEPWKTPAVVLLLTTGVLFLGCFVLWENVTPTPMIPPSVWENRSVMLVSLSGRGGSVAPLHAPYRYCSPRTLMTSPRV